ncbi:MAG: hypothetical protein ACI906_004773 [Candidatus Latescibacterota bacterium]|jgi:hypothetical protein
MTGKNWSGLQANGFPVIVIADAGPLLHLYWVGVSSWALPSRSIHVVDEVWDEVEKNAPEALKDARLQRGVTF